MLLGRLFIVLTLIRVEFLKLQGEVGMPNQMSKQMRPPDWGSAAVASLGINYAP